MSTTGTHSILEVFVLHRFFIGLDLNTHAMYYRHLRLKTCQVYDTNTTPYAYSHFNFLRLLSVSMFASGVYVGAS